MGKDKIVLTSRLSNSEINLIKDEIKDYYELIVPETFSEEDILKEMDPNMEIILGNYVSKNILDKANIKLIQNPFAGVENFDYELLKNYDLKLCNSHSNSKAVAEHALALIFSIMRKIPYHDRLLREGNWNRDMKDINIFSTSLIGKKVGILGYGGIGRSLGKMLKSFDCKLMGMVRNKNKNYEELDFIGDEEDLEYIIKESDILVMALPLTEDTKGILNAENLKLMKDSAFLINISRGATIDEDALFNILKDGKIRGAAIDSWYNYPKKDEKTNYPSKKNEFHKLDNLVLSPHRAPLTIGELNNVFDAIENIKRYKKGEKLMNIVSLEDGY